MQADGRRMGSDRTMDDLLADLGADRIPAAAGCSAALTGAVAAALLAMAARAAAPHWDHEMGALAQAQTLGTRLRGLAERDSRAYQHAADLLASATHTAPDPDEDDREDRDRQLASALLEAAAVPLAIAEAAADLTTLAAQVAHGGSDQRRADAQAAASLAHGATQAAATLVLVNLAVSGDDPLATRAHAALSATARWHHTTHENA